MDADILQQARVNYFLGNYGKVLEIWQNFDETSCSDTEYYYFVITRALIAQRELKPNSSLQFTKKPSPKLLELTEMVSKFMGPLLRPANAKTSIEEDRKYIENALKRIQESFDDKNNKLLKVICAIMSVSSCDV